MSALQRLFAALLLALCLPLSIAQAEDALNRADEAVATILFEYDGSEEFASYRVGENGSVDITFADNTPDVLYGEILQQMKEHPDISWVLSGKSGPSCNLW